MYDASLYYRKKVVKVDVPDDFILLTIQRTENTDDPARLKSIVSAINAVPEKNFIFPVHSRTKKILTEQGAQFNSHVTLIEPVGYLEMLKYEESCSAVLTDSGGVQKEAFFFKKPCITMRDSTEWVELVTSGWNTLAGADTDNIIFIINNLKIPEQYLEFYGDGQTAEKIVSILNNSF